MESIAKYINNIVIPVGIILVFILFNIPKDTVTYDLVLQIFAGIILAMAVFWINEYLKNERRQEEEFNKLNIDHKRLIVNLKRLLRRQNSPWNFTNETSSFYFDGGKVNQTFDLMRAGNGFWEIHVTEHNNQPLRKHKLDRLLIEFVDVMEELLIIAEKLDSQIKKILINPSIAASMQSGDPLGRELSKMREMFNFCAYRSALAGVNLTDFIFGYSFHSTENMSFDRINSLIAEANALRDDNNFSELIQKLDSGRVDLNNKINLIKKELVIGSASSD